MIHQSPENHSDREQTLSMEKIINELLKEAQGSSDLDLSHVNLLFEPVASEDSKTAKHSARQLFSSLVEPLLDSFTVAGRDAYYKIFAEILQIARKHPEGRSIDENLNRFGIKSSADLLRRKSRVVSIKRTNLHFETVKKVFILSRVTIGADVAITSIMVEKAKRLFPDAKIALFGSAKMGELFSAEKRVELIPVTYNTETFFTRLDSWTDLLGKIQDRPDDEFIIIDPDSRFTQLGLLPLLEPAMESQRYFFYESTVKEEPPASFHTSINSWFDTVFKESESSFGTIYPSRKDIDTAETLFKNRGLGDSFVVAANFGVGGNASKRIDGNFERELVKLLLKSGVTLLLDEGFGREEITRIGELRDSFSHNPNLITFRAGVGEFSALIKKSSLYIGYDSMGQHVAAACSVPEIIIFKGYHGPNFPARWAPKGRSAVETVLANGKRSDEVLSLVGKALFTILKHSGRQALYSDICSLHNSPF